MGNSIFTIAGLPETWPEVNDIAIKDVFDQIEAAKRTVGIRINTRYIRVDTVNGSNAGGGGDGMSPATAWRCRHMADLRTLMANNIATNTAYLFRRGDVFYADAANSAQGIQAPAFGGYTLGAYVDPAAPSSVRPQLLGFIPVPPISWTGVSNHFECTPGITPYWIRAGTGIVNSNDYLPYRYTGIDRAASSGAVDSNAGQWFYTGGVIYFRPPSAYLAGGWAAQIAVATGPGISLGDYDDIVLQDLIVEGWGMDTPNGNGSCVLSVASGTKEHKCINVDGGWGPYHSGFFHQPATGGLFTLIECGLGYFMVRGAVEAGFPDNGLGASSAGGGDSCVSYATNGANELTMIGCTVYGAALLRLDLPGADVLLQGTACYTHANGTNLIGFHLRRKNNITLPNTVLRRHASIVGSANGFATYDAAGNASGTATFPVDGDQKKLRVWLVDEIGSANLASNTMSGVWINNKWTFELPPPSGANLSVLGVAGNLLQRRSVNTVLFYALSGAWAGKSCFSSQFSSTYFAHDWGNELRIVDAGLSSAPNADFFSWEANAARTANHKFVNCLFSQAGKAANLTVAFGTQNQPTHWNTGGMQHCGQFQCRAADFNSANSRNVNLTAAATWPLNDAGRSLIPAALIGVGEMAEGRKLDYDITWARRPEKPTLGALEARPVFTSSGRSLPRTRLGGYAKD